MPAGTWLGAVYDLATIKKWLEVFLYRFVKISQFKRSAILRGPKAGFGGSLSPRGDWRAPSDSEPEVFAERTAGERARLTGWARVNGPGGDGIDPSVAGVDGAQRWGQ